MIASVIETIASSELFMMHHTRTIRHWLITIPGTGYRCEIMECSCGLRDEIGTRRESLPMEGRPRTTRYGELIDVFSVPRVECLCTASSCKLGKRTRKCHGWHRKRVDQLIAKIEKMPARHRISTSMRSYERTSA